MNEFEIAARTTKAYHLVKVLEPVLLDAVQGTSETIADLCARLDNDTWNMAATKADVNLPSHLTKATVVAILREREQEAKPSASLGQLAPSVVGGEGEAAPADGVNGTPSSAETSPPRSGSAAPESATQESIFDAGAATLQREAAIDRVEANADSEWADRALDAVRAVARRKATFIVDEVWQELGEEPKEPRAMGAVIRRAASEGVIVATPKYEPSERVTAHRNPRRVWQSLILVQEISA